MGSAASLIAALQDDGVPCIGTAVVLMSILVRAYAPLARKNVRATLVLLALYVALVPVAAELHEVGLDYAREVRLAALIFAALAIIGSAGTLLFAIALPRVRVNTPPILQDMAVASWSLIAIFALASRSGINISGLIATSAVLTAVIGLSFQDTLGNLVGGLAVQLDKTVQVGDWVKVDDVLGRVLEIRWRYTAIETREWETAILPNSLLVKGRVLVLGRRAGHPVQWHRLVGFDVDLETPPTDVIAAVDEALQALPIANVGADPKAHCELSELQGQTGKYVVNYWLTELSKDTFTDSVIRTRIYFALRRAGIEFAGSTHAIQVSQTSESKAEHGKDEHARRMRAIAKVDLFVGLPEDERHALADALRPAPFARGERMTRQGAHDDWLYMIVTGEADARVHGEGSAEREVARFGPGQFFGEMSMLTGEPRTATIVALSDVQSYILDKAPFQDVVHRRPEIADQIADVLAQRKAKLVEAQEDLSHEALMKQMRTTRTDLVSKMRKFFSVAPARASDKPPPKTG